MQWYNDKMTELAPLHNVYLTPTPANTEAFLALSRQQWSQVVDVLSAIEKGITGPYALGDQVCLADLHLTAWLARLMAVASQAEGKEDEVAALEKALQHECLRENAFASRGLSDKVRRLRVAARPVQSHTSHEPTPLPSSRRTGPTSRQGHPSRPSTEAVSTDASHRFC